MTPRLTRLEITLVAAICAIGFGLRAAYPSRMAVEHFDEGVYASNLYTLDGRYPFQHLYAPPLLPFCLEMAAIVGGPHAVMWVNVFSGSFTLLVLWGMVRQWWGPPAAIAAMALLAFNEFHITYSRTALTDAMLGLWMTAGVWAGWRAIQFGGTRNIVAAGVFASLAWWTKYNGWLTLAITGAGTAGWILFGGGRTAQASKGRLPADASPSPSTSKKRAKSSAGLRPPLAAAPKTAAAFGAARLYLGRWALTAAVAFLFWSPWLWELQQYGGYAAVAKNHAGYFTGLGQWWTNAGRQLSSFFYSCYAASSAGLVVAITLPLIVPWSTDAIALPDLSDEGARFSRQHAVWLSAAWWIGLSIAIPLYAPYPRIALPWIISCALGLGWVVYRRIANEAKVREFKLSGLRVKAARVGVAMVVVAAAMSPEDPRRGYAWQDRGGLKGAAEDVVSRLQNESLTREVEGVRCLLSVVAEPGLFFQLGAAQRNSPIGHVAVPAADFGAASSGSNPSGLPVFIVMGPHADQSEAERLIAEGRLELIAEFEYRPSDLVLLDSRPAWDLPPKDKPVVERIRLLHVKP